MTVSIAGDRPPSPRASPASNSTWPDSSVLRVARISLLRATSRTSALRDRLRRGQRIDEDMDAVIAGKRRQAHVGDDEPLRRQRAVIVVAAGALGRRRHHIDAGLQIAERLVDRERGGDVLVQRGRGGEFAGPDLDAALVAEIGELVAATASSGNRCRSPC